jgi:hypothetical protein
LQIHPNQGFTPLLLTAASPNPGSRQAMAFTTVASDDSVAAMVLTYVIFAYPEADNAGRPPPAPEVEIQTDAVGWQKIEPTPDSGPRSLLLQGGVANYTFAPLPAPGVARIRITRDDIGFDGQQWAIRFTNLDAGAVAGSALGVTFAVGTDDAAPPWIATPGQAGLTAAGAPTIDFGAALSALTLAGAGSPRPLSPGRTYAVQAPVGNYGPGPLTISAIAPGASGNYTLAAPVPVTIAPGCAAHFPATFSPPPEGQTAAEANRATFTLACNDPQAASAGPNAHVNTIAFNALATDFRRLYLRHPNHFSMFDVVAGATAFAQDLSDIADLAVAPDLATVYLSQAASVLTFDTARKAFGPAIALPPQSPAAPAPNLVIDPAGRWLYAAAGRQVCVIDTAAKAVARVYGGLDGMTNAGFAISPDGERLYLPNGAAGYTTLDARNGAVLSRPNPDTLRRLGASRIRITPDGRRLYIVSATESPGGLIVDAADTRVIDQIPTPGGLVDIVFSPNGQFGYSIDGDGQAARVIDLAANRIALDVNLADRTAFGIVMRPTGDACYILCANSLLAFDTASRSIARVFANLSAWSGAFG